jgi:hypothetical protein
MAKKSRTKSKGNHVKPWVQEFNENPKKAGEPWVKTFNEDPAKGREPWVITENKQLK